MFAVGVLVRVVVVMVVVDVVVFWGEVLQELLEMGSACGWYGRATVTGGPGSGSGGSTAAEWRT